MQAFSNEDRARDTTQETAQLKLLPRREVIASTSWLRTQHVGSDKGRLEEVGHTIAQTTQPCPALTTR